MKPSMLKRMERFNKAIEILEDLRKKEKDIFISDLYLTSVAERNIQIACEFALDFANFLLSKINAKIPETYKDIIEELEKNKIISPELKKKMKKIVGLRNIIVHWYADIKCDLIFDSLEEIINTLKNFIRTLLEYCKKKNIDP